jgi:hypothetical protein
MPAKKASAKKVSTKGALVSRASREKVVSPKSSAIAAARAKKTLTSAKPSAYLQGVSGKRHPATLTHDHSSGRWSLVKGSGSSRASSTTLHGEVLSWADGVVEDAPAVEDYFRELLEQIDAILIPGVIRRLVEGAPRISPRELAERMLAVAPAVVPANKMAEQVGPEFYDTAGVMVILASPGCAPVSKQAVEHRRRRRTILALQTADSRWIYPTWQFRGNEVLDGLPDVLAVFGDSSGWSVGTWLTTPTVELDDTVPVEWLANGLDRDRLIQVARRTARRWAA